MLRTLSKLTLVALLGSTLFITTASADEQENQIEMEAQMQEVRAADRERLVKRFETKIEKLQEKYDTLDNEEMQAETDREVKIKERAKKRVEMKMEMLQKEIEKLRE